MFHYYNVLDNDETINRVDLALGICVEKWSSVSKRRFLSVVLFWNPHLATSAKLSVFMTLACIAQAKLCYLGAVNGIEYFGISGIP